MEHNPQYLLLSLYFRVNSTPLKLQVKALREEEEERKKIHANHEMVEVLQKQMAAIEAHRRMEAALVAEEAQLLVSPVKAQLI